MTHPMKATPAWTPAQVIAEIQTWIDLSDPRRAVLTSSVRALEKIYEKARAKAGDGTATVPRVLTLECAALNRFLFRWPPMSFGYEDRRYANIVSDLRFVLRRLGRHDPVGGVATLPASWRALHDSLPTKFRRLSMVGFMQFCAGAAIEPAEVNDAALTRYETWGTERILLADPGAAARKTASNWNWAGENVDGWPKTRLARPNMRDQYTFPLERFEQPFQFDTKTFLDHLAALDRDPVFDEPIYVERTIRRRPLRKLKPRTISTRRWQIRALASALVHSGVPIEELMSLRDLVEPIERPRAALTFHRDRLRQRILDHAGADAEQPDKSSLLVGLADVLCQIALYHCGLPDTYVRGLRAWRSGLAPEQQTRMSPKNEARLAALMEERTRAKLLGLPKHWMNIADSMDPDDRAAALYALYSAALEIEEFCPMRRENLVKIDLDRDVERAPYTGLITFIIISGGDTKNRERLRWPVPEASAKLIEHYEKRYRPRLTVRENRKLFPAAAGLGARNTHELAMELSRRVEAELGVEFNIHILRHFAVWLFLNRHPGEYEVVRIALGHSSVEVTKAYYAGLEQIATAKYFDSAFQQERSETAHIAAAAFGKLPRKRGSLARRPARAAGV